MLAECAVEPFFGPSCSSVYLVSVTRCAQCVFSLFDSPCPPLSCSPQSPPSRDLSASFPSPPFPDLLPSLAFYGARSIKSGLLVHVTVGAVYCRADVKNKALEVTVKQMCIIQVDNGSSEPTHQFRLELDLLLGDVRRIEGDHGKERDGEQARCGEARGARSALRCCHSWHCAQASTLNPRPDPLLLALSCPLPPSPIVGSDDVDVFGTRAVSKPLKLLFRSAPVTSPPLPALLALLTPLRCLSVRPHTPSLLFIGCEHTCMLDRGDTLICCVRT